MSCVSQYFDYQNSIEELLEGLGDELWQLMKEDIEDCNELQVKLLDSSWILLRKYNLPDEYRLTQDKFRMLSETFRCIHRIGSIVLVRLRIRGMR